VARAAARDEARAAATSNRDIEIHWNSASIGVFASGDSPYSTDIANAHAWRTIVVSRRTNARKYDAKAKVDAFDWPRVFRSLDADGTAVLPRLLEPGQCARLAAGYSNDDLYRSRIVMARHGFGRGEPWASFPRRALTGE